MARRCIIHIGMHKTGSSSIQNCFHGYDDGRLAYLPMREPNHSQLLNLLFPGHRLKHFLQQGYATDPADFAERAKRARRNLRAAIESTDRDLIISAEGLSNLRDNTSVEDVRAFLEPDFENITVIAYVRPPGSYIASAFQQILKHRFVSLDPRRLYPGYQQKFAPWDEIFGRANVDLVLYDRSTLFRGDVVADFARRVGADDTRLSSQLSNESLNAEAVATVFKLRAEAEASDNARSAHKRVNKLVPLLSGFGTSQFALRPDIVDAILAERADDIAWIERRMGQVFPAFVPNPEALVFATDADLIDYADQVSAAFSKHLRQQRLRSPVKRLLTTLRRKMGLSRTS